MTATYYGNTAGSTLMNPPIVIAQAMMGSIGNAPGLVGSKLWLHHSTGTSTDFENSTPVITDAQALGVVTGDVFICVSSTLATALPILSLGVVISVSTAGAYLSSGSRISSTFA